LKTNPLHRDSEQSERPCGNVTLLAVADRDHRR
jgi:hypothetical protein